MVTSILVSSCFRTPFASQPIHVSQTLLEHALQRFYPNFPLLFKKVSWKISPLLRSQILGIFGNTFTAGRMYSCHTWDKLQQQVQTLLSHKRRIFSAILFAFLESTQNFIHFEQKGQLHSLYILEVIDTDKCGYFNARKLLFWNTLPQ